MPTNFEFIKTIDKNLYAIISDAEKLYRDEYFEQAMTQTRRFAEHVCKSVLGANARPGDTFDESLATLKDKSRGNAREKEFLDDLYFLKKHGNTAAHSINVDKDGITALECLQRAFEVAINYAVMRKGPKPEILDLHYDTELLVTGERNPSLKERYNKQKRIYKKEEPLFQEIKPKKKVKKAKKKPVKNLSKNIYKKSIPFFWIILGIATIISLVTLAVLFFPY